MEQKNKKIGSNEAYHNIKEHLRTLYEIYPDNVSKEELVNEAIQDYKNDQDYLDALLLFAHKQAQIAILMFGIVSEDIKKLEDKIEKLEKQIKRI